WVSAEVAIGPRQIIGVSWSTSTPIDMLSIPCARIGTIDFPSGLYGLPDRPSMFGMLGPYTSASSTPTRAPSAASAKARFTEVVDFPTPPLPEPTAMMLRIFGSGESFGCTAWAGTGG